MMKKVILLLLFTGINVSLLFSQIDEKMSNAYLEYKIVKNREMYNGSDYSRIEGSAYFPEEFVNGKVFLLTGDSLRVSLRYDLFQDQVEFKDKEKILWLAPANVKSVQVADEMMEVHNYMKGDKAVTGYFVCVKCGKNSLLKKQSVRFVSADAPKAFQETRPARFEKNDDEYYLKTADGQFFKAKNKSDLEDNFAGKQQVSAFIKTNKIKAGKEKDLLKLVDYLNTLD
ncbi:MAG: hypothetical protein Q8928_14290 [Bacteroidota bacterium]|nr:hypothetical protein [Bacteroidota bacterium]